MGAAAEKAAKTATKVVTLTPSQRARGQRLARADTPAAGVRADACLGRHPRSGRVGRRFLGQKPPQLGVALFSRTS